MVSIATPTLWFGFSALVLIVITIDLGLGQRKAHAPSMKEAAFWTAVWISVAMAFNFWLYRVAGSVKAMEFLTGYIIEYSLSVDNLFVFIMIFSFFGVLPEAQPRLLKWGIIGAVILRALFVLAGATLLHHFHWMIYVFGVFLVFTGIKMVSHGEEKIHPEKNPLVKLMCRIFPVKSDYEGTHFFTVMNGKRAATPLLVALVAIESTDVVFAVDSIPAIYGITSDPFIVYTSNIFAIMGLRSLFFLLAGAMGIFHYLKLGVAIVLVFVGIKMTIAGFYPIGINASLATVFGILTLSILASLVKNRRERAA